MSTQPINAAGHRIPTWTIGDRLRKAREENGMDQGSLAWEMGVARATVSNCELGITAKPRRIVLNAWAAATGVDIGWLTFGDGPKGGGGGPTVQPAGYTGLSVLHYAA